MKSSRARSNSTSLRWSSRSWLRLEVSIWPSSCNTLARRTRLASSSSCSRPPVSGRQLGWLWWATLWVALQATRLAQSSRHWPGGCHDQEAQRRLCLRIDVSLSDASTFIKSTAGTKLATVSSRTIKNRKRHRHWARRIGWIRRSGPHQADGRVGHSSGGWLM